MTAQMWRLVSENFKNYGNFFSSLEQSSLNLLRERKLLSHCRQKTPTLSQVLYTRVLCNFPSPCFVFGSDWARREQISQNGSCLNSNELNIKNIHRQSVQNMKHSVKKWKRGGKEEEEEDKEITLKILEKQMNFNHFYLSFSHM